MIVLSAFYLKYVSSYKSGCGFSERVLTAGAEKTKDIDFCHQHGGVLVDEIELYEDLVANGKGLVYGFVDLCADSTAEKEACHHGLVVMFQLLKGK